MSLIPNLLEDVCREGSTAATLRVDGLDEIEFRVEIYADTKKGDDGRTRRYWMTGIGYCDEPQPRLVFGVLAYDTLVGAEQIEQVLGAWLDDPEGVEEIYEIEMAEVAGRGRVH